MEIGDRMKMYEKQEAGRQFLPLLPICARLDGKGFSKFTKSLARPYDKRLSELMRHVTLYLVAETNAIVGYTGSDEISLVWYTSDFQSQIFYNGKIQKMNSILASMTTGYFNKHLSEFIPEKQGSLAIFDCRIWQLPNLEEVANTLLWRELDTIRNSISTAARTYFSHKEIDKKSSNDKLKMLLKKGIDWQEYPSFYQRGVYIQKRKIYREFSPEEIEKLPPQHAARKNSDIKIERSELQILNLPPLSSVQNRPEVLFFGKEPNLKMQIEL